MDEARWGVVFPGISMPVLMLRADCSFFALKPARSSPYLPALRNDGSFLMKRTIVASSSDLVCSSSASLVMPVAPFR